MHTSRAVMRLPEYRRLMAYSKRVDTSLRGMLRLVLSGSRYLRMEDSKSLHISYIRIMNFPHTLSR